MTVYLWLMNIGLYIESTCFFNFRVGNKFSYLDILPLARITKSAVSLGLFSKVSVHFFLPGSSITSFLSQITVSFSKLFNKIALKSFLFILDCQIDFRALHFLWIKILPFYQQYLHPLVRLSHNKFVTIPLFSLLPDLNLV